MDVEEHFHVNAFEPYIDRADWGRQPSRVDASTAVLDLLARHGTRGTFFVVGWLADRNPGLVRRIAAAGHEIASHSWWHRRVATLTPGEFREDVRAKAPLEEITGSAVRGFRRRPSRSSRAWNGPSMCCSRLATPTIQACSPSAAPAMAGPAAPTTPFDIVRPGGTLREYPMTTLNLAGLRIPAAGGGAPAVSLRSDPARF